MVTFSARAIGVLCRMALPWTTAEEAVALVNNGDRVFIHGSAATPHRLVNALFARAGKVDRKSGV